MDLKQIARILGRRKALSHRHAGKWVIGSASSTSGSRKYRLWVPPNPDGREQSPLVMMLHGCGQSAKDLAKIYGMNAIADRNNSWSSIPNSRPRPTPCDVGIGSIQITRRASPENPLSWLLLSSKLCRHIMLIPIVFMWQVFPREQQWRL
jgi:hypothetical protein